MRDTMIRIYNRIKTNNVFVRCISLMLILTLVFGTLTGCGDDISSVIETAEGVATEPSGDSITTSENNTTDGEDKTIDGTTTFQHQPSSDEVTSSVDISSSEATTSVEDTSTEPTTTEPTTTP